MEHQPPIFLAAIGAIVLVRRIWLTLRWLNRRLDLWLDEIKARNHTLGEKGEGERVVQHLPGDN